MHKNVVGKDLTKESPRSPRVRVGGYAILGRTLDKCRALVAGNVGEYHFDCPLDNMLFGFKGVMNGEKRTPDEVKRWSDEVEGTRPYDDPERRDWFIEQTKPLGLDPSKISLFDWLETDDKASHAKAA